ncbi:alpha/beta fold hydrolase [Alteromonas sp. 1_MG-2023]|uniref:alpha/beta fold hydrolase n=1 Tax=Alteromonas sp. 1_MG-2023 TaxID=3062669 RepID=UPI0026E1D9F1|nr:alpha/beta fold hydrolase [Alteromonas sp. 1_MG-2023]MDO6569222.1 alpha/beta fold hydrolase [Alteromonas sp. 1_MG-2023]
MFRIIASMVLLLMLSHTAGCATAKVSSPKYQADDEIVVLAHGLGRSDWAMWLFAHRIEHANYKVCLLDYATIGVSVASLLDETTRQIDTCLQNAPKVHFVGHSLGGLVIRAYLQNNEDELESVNVGEVVLIGTPNKGSELADYYSDSWLMNLGGGVSRALVTGSRSLGNNLDAIDFNIGVIAGTKPLGLTRNKFKGPNDGLVSVESTKLEGMSDFITIEVGHSQMRYSEEVANQTIHFLQQGAFEH